MIISEQKNRRKDLLMNAHTRVLMDWRKHAMACGGQYNPIDNNYPGTEIPLTEINEELNTREHIPNKQEAKLIRQNKAKLKK
jgi:hypothetical protein